MAELRRVHRSGLAGEFHEHPVAALVPGTAGVDLAMIAGLSSR